MNIFHNILYFSHIIQYKFLSNFNKVVFVLTFILWALYNDITAFICNTISNNISQKVILQNIKPFLKNKVVIIVAHRLSTIKDADNIYIMNNGEVIEEGSHDELLLNKGAYFSMLNTKYIEEIAN